MILSIYLHLVQFRLNVDQNKINDKWIFIKKNVFFILPHTNQHFCSFSIYWINISSLISLKELKDFIFRSENESFFIWIVFLN